MVKPGPKTVKPLPAPQMPRLLTLKPTFLMEAGGEEKRGWVREAGVGAASLGLRLLLLDVAPAPSTSLRGSPLSRPKALGATPLSHMLKNPRALSQLPPPHRMKQAAPFSWKVLL